MQNIVKKEALPKGCGGETDNPTTGTLTVRMLGEFSLFWKGRQICRDARGKDSQVTRLLEVLIYHRNRGVPREKIEKLLFEGKEYVDLAQMRCSVVHNAKKKLVQAGLPDEDHITYHDGNYYWSSPIRIDEDVERFCTLYEQAGKLSDAEEKTAVLLEACQIYRGEFLPFQTRLGWVRCEGKKYAEMFHVCVQETVKILRNRDDFVEMEKLGRYAARVQPFEEWETVVMEALVGMNRHREAMLLYEDTAERYMDEMGIHVAMKADGLLEKMSEMYWPCAGIDDIQKELSDAGGKGGYLCPYPIFRGIYRSVLRMTDRSGLSAYLMVCTLLDSKGNPMKEGRVLERVMTRLEEVVVASVRRSDVVCRYGNNQYLILLLNTCREDSSVVERRINAFLTGKGRRVKVNCIVGAV